MLLTQESDCKHTVPEVPDRFQALVDPSCLRQQEYLFFGVWGKLSSRAQEAWNWVVPHDSLPTRQTVQCRVWGCTSHQGGGGHQYLVGPLIKVPYWVLWIKPGLAISKARVLTLTPSLQIWEVSPIGHQLTESRGCACSFGEEGCWEEPSARKEQLRMMSKEVRTGAWVRRAGFHALEVGNRGR